MNKRSEHLPVVDPDDIGSNDSKNEAFSSVLNRRVSRRNILRGSLASAAGAFLGSVGLTACGGGSGDSDTSAGVVTTPPAQTPTETLLGFTAVGKSLADQVVVPAGYTATVMYALGDPLTAATPAYKNDGTDTDFDKRAGDHHDGMEYFGLSASGTRDASGSERGLLAMNHEALTQQFLHAAGASANPRPATESDKEMAAHGISVVEVRRGTNGYTYLKDSSFNRRVTPLTTIQLSGPARGNLLMRTRFSATGNETRGTINNCGTGITPWGTLLTGEENWGGYFARNAGDVAVRGADTEKSNVSLRRYGIDPRAQRVSGVSKDSTQAFSSRHGWETTTPAEDKYQRWNISQTGATATDDYRNEANTYGYIVEIDPYDKTAAIKKRTALGRFAHESAAFAPPVAGQPLVCYMGDDSQGEYVYKFVSDRHWEAADANAANRIAVGDKYLDSGKLYVAKFNDDGSGEWILLSIDNGAIATFPNYAFANQGDVLINTRLAADAVGATKMDRPEWCSVHPTTGEVYYTLTNNSNRRLEPNGSQFGLDPANPRAYTDTNDGGTSSGNVNGHIIRMAEANGDVGATSFKWDVYLFGAEAEADPNKINLSSLTADQDFSSPDGLAFSKVTGLCWIQTDDGAYTDVTNCMMLAAIPGRVGDGGAKTLSYTRGDGSTVDVTTHAGKPATADTLKRFLVGPKDCEITGIAETPDGRALFVNIQHPGETISRTNVGDPSKYVSHWPSNAGYGAGGATGRPRSATIVITKNDGGRIGT